MKNINQTYGAGINGIVKNGTNNIVKSVKVTADIYDKNGNKLTQLFDIIDSLNPGETWKFDLFTTTKEFTHKNLKVTYYNK